MMPLLAPERLSRASWTGDLRSAGVPQPRRARQLRGGDRVKHVLRRRGSCMARASHYEVLGIPPDASDEDVRSAFRRRAKELHPDVNKEPNADELFMEVNEAYETLSDSQRRQQYDRANGLRKLNFFQDVEDDGDDNDEDEEVDRSGQEADGDDEASSSDRYNRERLEELLRFMDRFPGGRLSQFQPGRQLDPWGDSSTDAWRRQVEKQSGSDYLRRGSGFGERDGVWPPGRGDDVFTKRPGWQAPGREGQEWQPPQRQWDQEDRERRGGGGDKGGGGGGFRQPFRI